MTASTIIAADFDPTTWILGVHGNTLGALGLAAGVGLVLVMRHAWRRGRLEAFEIDSAEFGFGGGSVTLKPNTLDRQVAYEIWVELATRKLGMPMDLQNDVVTEIYDSWRVFFGVARDLIKTIPVTRAASPSTHAIIRLSIAVLNEGLRPHLTIWQSRFRNWIEREIAKGDKAGADLQTIQQDFPRWADLVDDILRVNALLIAYRLKMEEIVYGAAGAA